MKKIAVLFLALGVLPVSFAEEMAPLAMPSTRGLGMGGTHVAYTDDVYALFVNPAALQRANQGSAFEFSLAFVGPLFDLIDLANSAGDDLTGALGDFAKNTGGKIPIGFELRGPLSIGYTANGLGFGFWNRVHEEATVIGTDISASVFADLIMNFGMSFSILSLGNHEVDAGFVVKPFVRAKGGMAVTALDAIGGGLDNIIEEFNVPLIAGGGFDLGFMYRFHNDLAVGMTIDDVYTRGGRIATLYGDDDGVSSYQTPATLNLGVAYTLQPISWLGFAFMLDCRDVTNLFHADDYTKKNPILNLAFGTELSIFKFLKLRFGFNEMLPAAGIGLGAKAVQLNVAIYGKELSNEPGGFSTYGLDLSIAIRPQTKERSWPWNRRSIVNSILEKKAERAARDPDPAAEAAEAEAAAVTSPQYSNPAPAGPEPDPDPDAAAEAEAAAAASLQQLDEALAEPEPEPEL
jgi:hypothetical protein